MLVSVTYCRLGLFVVSAALCYAGQSGEPSILGGIISATPSPAPPQPPVKEAPTPVTPKAIYVDPPYAGPGGRWVNRYYLSHHGTAEAEHVLLADPDNVEAHGRLAAECHFRMSASCRLSEVLWMIQHHPEWDGFLLAPFYNPTGSWNEERETYDSLKPAWMLHTYSQSAVVLHNAAMFFAISEPRLAADLLQRAIALEPKNTLYVQRLGMVYALSLISPEVLKKLGYGPGAVSSRERTEFAQRAQEALSHSQNWLLLQGTAEAACPRGLCSDEVNSSPELRRILEICDRSRELIPLPEQPAQP
jgi:hypothetical protein